MRILNVTMKRFAKFGLLLMMGVSMNGCSNTMEWEEEVKLHDGQIIVAERFYNLGGYPGLESHNRMALDETVTFHLPGSNKTIVWKTDFRHSTVAPSSLNHFRFDIVNGMPYLATYPAGCISYNKWGRPNPPQILFKYENEQWKRISLAELPPELIGTTANVIVGSPDERILKSFYSVEGVNAQNRDISTPEYRTVLREPIPNVWSGCGEMIRKRNGGWDGIGWFRDQPSKNACLKYCEQKEVSVQDCPCDRLFKGK